jgi:hypothetical protein
MSLALPAFPEGETDENPSQEGESQRAVQQESDSAHGLSQ